MKNFVFVILVLILAACSTISLTPETISIENDNLTDTITFTGQASRGKIFEKEISEDLLFRLMPTEYADIGIVGWSINIINKSYPEHELA